MVRRSATATRPRQSPLPPPLAGSASMNIAACRRSSRLGRRRSETNTRQPTLASNDQNVPCITGSQPLRWNSACGRSQSQPNRPCCSHASERISAGNSNVYSHTAKPATRPTITPRRLAPRQYNAAISAGANCATAANASRPVAARFSAFAATR